MTKIWLNLFIKKKYKYQEKEASKQIGVVNGMAYTVFGGDILPIEVTYYKGKGDLILTVGAGDVVKVADILLL